MSTISIIKAGLLTTLQDGGRIGFQQYGIPVAGAMDQYALQLGNILVGNERYEAALEFTLMGPTIKYDDSSVFAITGGDFKPTLNGKNIKMYQTIYANKGDELKFSTAGEGCRGYLAIAGGFNVEMVMGSRSTYLRGAFGGFEGRKLKDGDVIPLNSSCNTLPVVLKVPMEMIPQYESSRTLRVIMGPELNRFNERGRQTFLNEVYQLSNQCDRMGYRLEGPEIQHLNGADIISGGINLGAIQIPGDGKPIIMMADHQTTGGYTKIANVISIDVPYLAQMKPGDQVRFQEVIVEEAHRLLHQQEAEMEILINRFQQEKEEQKKIISKREFKLKLKGISYSVIVEEKVQ